MVHDSFDRNPLTLPFWILRNQQHPLTPLVLFREALLRVSTIPTRDTQKGTTKKKRVSFVILIIVPYLHVCVI